MHIPTAVILDGLRCVHVVSLQAFLGWQQASGLQQQDRLQTSSKKEVQACIPPDLRLRGTKEHGAARATGNNFYTKLIFPLKWSEGTPETSSPEQILFTWYAIHNPLGPAALSFPAPSISTWLHLRA